jgi:hypothetical protein
MVCVSVRYAWEALVINELSGLDLFLSAPGVSLSLPVKGQVFLQVRQMSVSVSVSVCVCGGGECQWHLGGSGGRCPGPVPVSTWHIPFTAGQRTPWMFDGSGLGLSAACRGAPGGGDVLQLILSAPGVSVLLLVKGHDRRWDRWFGGIVCWLCVCVCGGGGGGPGAVPVTNRRLLSVPVRGQVFL